MFSLPKILTKTIIPTTLLLAVSGPVQANTIKVGCVYKEGSLAKVSGFCDLQHQGNGRIQLTWPDQVKTDLKFGQPLQLNQIKIDNKNIGKLSLGSNFYYMEYQTSEGQRRAIFIVGSCLRCS